MKFRKKPVVIEAEQFWPNEKPYPIGVRECSLGGYSIDTLEGVMMVSAGDYVITGAKGERYPCKPDIFDMTYEKVEE